MRISSIFPWMANRQPVRLVPMLPPSFSAYRAFQLAAAVAKPYFLYELFDSAIAQTLVVDTCRHGTTFRGWRGIGLLGGKPTSEGHPGFFVWCDTRFYEGWEKHKVRLGTWKALDGPLCYSKGNPATILKFHLRPDDSSEQTYWEVRDGYTDFEINNSSALWSYTLRTQKHVPLTKLGIPGSLLQGINFGLPWRVYYNPRRFTQGIVQGAIALKLTALWYGNSVPRVAGWVSKGEAILLPRPQINWALRYRIVSNAVKGWNRFWNTPRCRYSLQAVGYAALWYSCR